MAEEDKSFATLVAEAPPAPAEGVVSLVGTLARSSEHGKFVLILQDGQTITLETSAVKGHAVLGASLGRTIVRIDVEAGKVVAPQAGPPPFESLLRNTGTGPWLDPGTTDFWRDVAAPFTLATPHQAPANILEALSRAGFVSHLIKLPGEHAKPPLDTPTYRDTKSPIFDII